MGTVGVTILTACVCGAIFSLAILMLIFGKRLRLASQKSYQMLASRQFQDRRQD